MFANVLFLALDPVFVSRIAEGLELDSEGIGLIERRRSTDPTLHHIAMALRAGVQSGDGLDRMYGEGPAAMRDAINLWLDTMNADVDWDVVTMELQLHARRNPEFAERWTYRILIEDKVFDAPVGISVTVPRGSRHSWRNISNETGRLLVYGWDS
jgi:hypothetical protein